MISEFHNFRSRGQSIRVPLAVVFEVSEGRKAISITQQTTQAHQRKTH